MATRRFEVTEEPFLEHIYSPDSPDTPNIDFVFVHGLNPSGRPNHAFQTWTHAESETLWPYKLLPEDFPQARIWIFGYNANVTRDVSEASISDHADSLLDVLQRKRHQGMGDHSRIPIIFLGHSLGGLVIKQALLNARENPLFSPTWEASFGLVFFGTPHRGGNTGGLAELAARLAKFFANDHTDNDLLMCLKPNSLFTQTSAERFRLQQNRYKILTFFETMPTKFHGINKIVVTRDSAKLGAAHEVCRDLNRDHRDICKFASRGSAYEKVQGNLRDIVVSPALISVGVTPPSSRDQPHAKNGHLSLGSTPTIAWSPPMHSQETITSQSSVSVSQSHFSPAEVKELNKAFLKAVGELDTLLIHKWVKDLSGRPILNAEHVQSALLALASMREPKKARFKREAEDFRVLAVSVILDHGVTNLECTDDVYEMTPLIFAACCGREAIVKLLIEKGASLQAKDGKLGRTALSWAARNNFPTTAQILFNALAERQDQQTGQFEDIDGWTALDLARQNGYRRIVELLSPRQQT